MAASGGNGKIEEEDDTTYTFVVVGGGIAGVTCAETLSNLCPDVLILLLTASPVIKAVTNFRKVTRTLEEFDVEERPMFELKATCPNVVVNHQQISALDSQEKTVTTKDGSLYRYHRLCLCTGGTPKVIAPDNPYVLGIRDTETVKCFQKRLSDAQRIVVVGNGGIATEMVYEIEGCEVVWAIKDSAITSTFIDAGAATFFLPMIHEKKLPKEGAIKRTKYRIDADVADSSSTSQTLGGALGPDWHERLVMKGTQKEHRQVHIEYKVEVDQVLSPEELKQSDLTPLNLPSTDPQTKAWPVYVKLTNGAVYGCDFVVSATGVVPNIQAFVNNNKFSVCEEDGAINVDHKMHTSVDGVYAAGDVCHANWTKSEFWIQMRLWSQARQMGAYAAQCMVADFKEEEISLDFCFEVFAHVTTFFNYKVVLLGKFNGQGLGENQELLLRMTKGMEYIKVVLQNNRMHGALMIGDTDMEETFENLILNQMDLTDFKEDLLNPNIDIDDFFD